MLHSIWRELRSWSGWVADREIFPLSVGVALATFTTHWAVWGLGLIVILWLLRWLGRGRLSVRTPIDWPVCVLLLIIPVTLYATTNPSLTFVSISRLLAGLALVYGLANWIQCGAQVTLLTLGLIWIGLGLALVAPVSVGWFANIKAFVIPAHVYSLFPTLAGDTIHPNMMAGALVMLLPFPLTFLIFDASNLPSVVGTAPNIVVKLLDKHWFRRLSCGLATLLMLTVLVLTKSRGAWIAGILVLFLVLVYRQRYFLGLVPLVLIGVGVLVWRGNLPALLDRIGSSGIVSGWQGRIEIWSRALYMIQDFPFTGIGAGTFDEIAHTFYPFFLIEPGYKVGHAHNLLLQVAVDLGLPGLIAFLSLLLATFWSALHSIKFYCRANQNAFEVLAWAAMVSLIGMLAHGMLDATTWIIGRGAFVPFAVIGTLMALANRSKVT